MAVRSGIEWTEATWNPTTGCDRVSPGCDNCYALVLAKRLKAMGSRKYQRDGDPRTSGPGFGINLHPDALELPKSWRAPRVVFVDSMSDLFHPDVPVGFLREVFAVMRETPRYAYQVLTKRSHRLRDLVLDLDWPSNAWIGVSVENERYRFRIDHLRTVPATLRFLSIDPLIGPLSDLDLTGIHWVIVGGESGPRARPMAESWVLDIRDQCLSSDVPFFFKQWGGRTPRQEDGHLTAGHTTSCRSVHRIGRSSDGSRMGLLDKGKARHPP